MKLHFTTIKAAKAAGYREMKSWEYDPEAILVKGKKLSKEPRRAKSETEWTKECKRVRRGQTAHGIKYSLRAGKYEVYREDQVEEFV